jgi:hypothetical protein
MSLQKIATVCTKGPRFRMYMAFVLVGSVVIAGCGGGSTSQLRHHQSCQRISLSAFHPLRLLNRLAKWARP